jgi:hypothetical protein
MTSKNQEFLDRWHHIVSTKDLGGLESILAEDVSIGAPPYWDNLEGRPLVNRLIQLIMTTIDDFTYHREWHDDSKATGEIALEFKGHVGGLDLQGIDLISLNDRGEPQHLDVMIRPINALEALRDKVGPKMMEFLSEPTTDRTVS